MGHASRLVNGQSRAIAKEAFLTECRMNGEILSLASLQFPKVMLRWLLELPIIGALIAVKALSIECECFLNWQVIRIPYLNIGWRLEVVKSSQMSKCTIFQLPKSSITLCFLIDCSSNLVECRDNLCIAERKTIEGLPLQEFVRKGINVVDRVFLRDKLINRDAETDLKDYAIRDRKK